jgi:5-methylcytosine-specific restriction endonuclease McrA
MTASAPLKRRRPEDLRALVLNADGRPISTWPLSLMSAWAAVHAVCNDRVIVIEEWDEAFHSPSRTIPVPKIVMLREYQPVTAEPKFCRRSVILRDRFRCQYCGEEFRSEELTFEHVIPRADGGKTDWDNILMACLKCNGIKGSHPANHSGRKGVVARGSMRPLKMPRRPTSAELLRAGLEFLPNDIREDFGSYLYWTAELSR